jgi:hypothetical protein
MWNKKNKDESEARSVEIMEELKKLDEGHSARMERWEEANKLCLKLAAEVSSAQLVGVLPGRLNEMRKSLQRSMWDRDKEKREADIKRTNLRRELGKLTKEVVDDAIQELEGVYEQAKKKRVSNVIKKERDIFAHKSILTLMSNDRAFSQITESVLDGRNKLTGMRERASIPMIKEFIKQRLEEISTISMELQKIDNVDGSLFNPLDDERPIPAPTTELYEQIATKYRKEENWRQLERKIDQIKK